MRIPILCLIVFALDTFGCEPSEYECRLGAEWESVYDEPTIEIEGVSYEAFYPYAIIPTDQNLELWSETQTTH